VENEEKEIGELSCKHQRIQTVMHYVNRKSLVEEHHRQCGNKAYGVDRETKESYGRKLEENITDMMKRMKSFTYRPKPVPFAARRACFACIGKRLPALCTGPVV
jgi:hypothetical protein